MSEVVAYERITTACAGVYRGEIKVVDAESDEVLYHIEQDYKTGQKTGRPIVTFKGVRNDLREIARWFAKSNDYEIIEFYDMCAQKRDHKIEPYAGPFRLPRERKIHSAEPTEKFTDINKYLLAKYGAEKLAEARDRAGRDARNNWAWNRIKRGIGA